MRTTRAPACHFVMRLVLMFTPTAWLVWALPCKDMTAHVFQQAQLAPVSDKMLLCCSTTLKPTSSSGTDFLSMQVCNHS